MRDCQIPVDNPQVTAINFSELVKRQARLDRDTCVLFEARGWIVGGGPPTTGAVFPIFLLSFSLF
jgi:hypothetical protein